uniref:Uncharacterized protein n=1 Tax=Heterorhabditis bacteriophora TaxID=37862 RepID=A0A1I7XTD2_HETBA
MKSITAGFQVAVIFAILLGGILLLALVIGVIYFVCVNNMRDDDKKRLQHSRNSASWPAQVPSYSAPYRERPSSVTLYNPTVTGQQQSYEFVPRSPIAASPAANMSTTPVYNPPTAYTPNPQYSQAPLVTPVSQEYITGNRVPQLQPDIIYTQQEVMIRAAAADLSQQLTGIRENIVRTKMRVLLVSSDIHKYYFY